MFAWLMICIRKLNSAFLLSLYSRLVCLTLLDNDYGFRLDDNGCVSALMNVLLMENNRQIGTMFWGKRIRFCTMEIKQALFRFWILEAHFSTVYLIITVLPQITAVCLC